MYPEKVGRVAIGGVYDANDYRAMQWFSNLRSTDDVIVSFFGFCYKAGPLKCLPYNSDATKIRERVDKILDTLENDPIPIPFAHGLVAVETRNTTTLAVIPQVTETNVECHCQPPVPWNEFNRESFYAIACGDGITSSQYSGNFTEYFDKLTEMPSFAAPLWGIHHIKCAKWNISAKWRYSGPFGAPNTSHPLLVLSPTFDRVTPLTDAKVVRGRFNGAGLLVQNSNGHSTFAAPSLCTARHVRAYFVDGHPPEEGTICEANELPFIGEVGEKLEALSAQDMDLMDALRGLASEVPMFGVFAHL